MQLTWLGAAGFKLDTSEGATLLIDPFLSRPKTASPPFFQAPADLSPVDEILLTHGRFDHAMDTPAITHHTGAIVHAPASLCDRLAGLGVSNHCLEPITFDKPKLVGSLMWQAIAGRVNQLDSSPVLRALTRSPGHLERVSQLDRDWPPGEAIGYYFEADGLSLAHFGTAGWIEAAMRGLRPDIALLPVECFPDTNSAVVELATRLMPKVVIPHHWDDYYPPLTRRANLKEFTAALHIVAPGITVHIPTIGRSFNPAKLL